MVNAAQAKRRLTHRQRVACHLNANARRNSLRGYPDLFQTHLVFEGVGVDAATHFPDPTEAVTFKFRVNRSSGTATGTIVTLGNEGTIGFNNGDLEVVTGGGPSAFVGTYVGVPRDNAEIVVAIQPTTGQVRAWIDSDLVIAGTVTVFPFSWATSGNVAINSIAGVDVIEDPGALRVFDGQLPRHFFEVAVGGGGAPTTDDLLFRSTRQGTDRATSAFPYTELDC